MPTRYDLKNKIAGSAGKKYKDQKNNGLISSTHVPSPNGLRTSGGPNADVVVVGVVVGRVQPGRGEALIQRPIIHFF